MIHRILVPLDGSSLAESVLPHVIAFARAFDAHVTLLRVLEHQHSEAVAIEHK
ncbi:MAG: universal stress protein [Caldilineaceae bacterium]|nr:universal stress protein [Caldilineaceae bacterium]